MKITRRDALTTALFGSGMLGLRAFATGLPISFLLNPRKALADTPAAPSCGTPQYIILNTSGSGDPINCNVPGTYDDPNITHSADPTMAPTQLTIQGKQYTAAAPWATLPQNVLDRTCFFHLMTNTPVHPKEPQVLQLQGATQANEMLPSVLAKQLAPCLKTIQNQPISVGATSPSETITFNGAPLPIIPPISLKATLANPTGELTNLQVLRDSTLNSLYDIYRTDASPAQKAYLDSLVTSTQQVRGIKQDLLAALTSIADNTPASQIIAAITLIQMGVSPVIAVHIPFGGDNHSDPMLKTEATETVSGVQSIATLMSSLATAGLQDNVTFLSLNVFGRTMGPSNTAGRQHNANHQVSIAIGKPFKGGVIGGVTPVGGDYGAMAIDPSTGAGSASGSIAAVDTLAAFGQTALTAVGADSATVAAQINNGGGTATIIKGALA
jgi:hypothetical protein